MKQKTCWLCHGSGKTPYIENPDSGSLDTQIWNLRRRETTCHECSGTGKTPKKKAAQ